MTYSIDYRKQVLSSIADGMTIREAALFYGLSTSTIHSWQQNLTPKTTRNKAPTKIPDDALIEDVKTYPNDYNHERARSLNCSKTGVFNALKRLGISQKKSLEHPKVCLIKRATFQNKLDNFKRQGHPIVYMAESGFESETIRPYGYAPIGTPCIDSYNWQAKKRTNVIGALSEKILFALDYFEQNTNSNIFYNWFKQTLIPSRKTKCVIVMDNARFHKNKRIRKLLNR